MSDTSYEIARQVIQKYFSDRFLDPTTSQPWKDAAGDLIQVEYPNHILSDEEGTADTPWCRFKITHGISQASDVGNYREEIPGEVALQIFLPEDSGVKLARQIADSVRAFMRNVHLGTPDGLIKFRTISVRELTPDQGWDQTLVTCPFVRFIYEATPYAAGGNFIPYPP